MRNGELGWTIDGVSGPWGPGGLVVIVTVLAAAFAIAWLRRAPRGRVLAAASIAADDPGAELPLAIPDWDPLDDDEDGALDAGARSVDGEAVHRPFGPDGRYGFLVQGESGIPEDGLYRHTQILRVADGLVLPAVSVELIAPTLRHAEFLRGDVVVARATAHGGVLTLHLRDVSGHLEARFHTVDPADRVRAYWRCD